MCRRLSVFELFERKVKLGESSFDETRLRDPGFFRWENPEMLLDHHGSEVFHSLPWLPEPPLPFKKQKKRKKKTL